MFDRAKILVGVKAGNGSGCPFSALSFKDPLDAILPIISSLPLNRINSETITQIAQRCIDKIPEDSILARQMKSLSAGDRVAYLAKGVLYRKAVEHLRNIKNAALQFKELAPTTCGFGEIRKIALKSDGIELEYSSIDPSDRFAAIKSPVELAREITYPLLANIKLFSVAYSSYLAQADLPEYKLLEVLISFLPGRATRDVGLWLSSGFEAAMTLPMDLFRVNLYRGLIQGQKKEYDISDLRVLAKNSFELLKILASGSFDVFNAQRDFVSKRCSRGEWQLKHGFFELIGNPGDMDLHVDFKQKPLAGVFTAESELVCGCPGKAWIRDFHLWSLELHDKYFIPNLDNILSGAVRHIREEGDTSVRATEELICRINRHHLEGGRPIPFPGFGC